MSENTISSAALPKQNRFSKAFFSAYRHLKASVVNLCVNDYQLLLAFAVPFGLMIMAYIVFGINPWEGESVLSLDLNGQYVYYYDYMYDVLAGKESLFYSWSRNLSGEFMGIIGYYLASPFNFIVWLFPRECITDGLFAMMITKIGAIGLCCGIYLSKCKGCSRLTTVIFSTLYAMCSYSIVQTMNPMWLDGVMVLPLVLFGLEKLVDEGKFRLFIISLAYAFVTCFYIGYMIGIFSAMYFIYYLSTTDKLGKMSGGTIARRILLCGFSALVALMISAFMILPVQNSLSLGKFDFSVPDYSIKTNFDLIDLLGKLLPNSYDTVRMIGLPFIYCGTLTLLMIPIYFVSRHYSIREKIGTVALISVLFVSMFITPIDMFWHGGQLPNWLPYRYSFMASLLMIIMGAKGFERMKDVNRRFIGVTAALYFGVLIYLESRNRFLEDLGSEGRDVLDSLMVILPAMLVLFVVTAAVLQFKYKLNRRACAIGLCVVIFGEAYFSTLGNLMKQDQDIVYSSRASYVDVIEPTREVVQEIQAQDDGFYRMEKTYHRSVNDPLALNMYGLSHSSSTLNAKPIALLGLFGFTSRSHYTRYSGATSLTDDIFGVKYVLSTEGNTTSIKSKDDITVTKNDDAMPIAYLVDSKTQNLMSTTEYQKLMAEINEQENKKENGEKNNYDEIKALADEHYLLLQKEEPFDNQTLWMKTMLGDDETPIYFERVYETDFIPENVTQGTASGGHKSFKVVKSGENAQIEYIFTIEKTGRYYMYFPTSYERTVNVWINDRWIEDTEFEGTHDWGGNYFEGDNYCIKCFGEYEAGDHVSVILTLTQDELYFKDAIFMWENSELIAEDTARLQAVNENTVVEAKSTTDFVITTDCPEDKLLMTTIPDEPGWKAYVDGVETKYETAISRTLIAIPLTAGAHTVELVFTTAYYPAALIISLAGIIFFIGMALLWCKMRKIKSVGKLAGDNITEETETDDFYKYDETYESDAEIPELSTDDLRNSDFEAELYIAEADGIEEISIDSIRNAEVAPDSSESGIEEVTIEETGITAAEPEIPDDKDKTNKE